VSTWHHCFSWHSDTVQTDTKAWWSSACVIHDVSRYNRIHINYVWEESGRQLIPQQNVRSQGTSRFPTRAWGTVSELWGLNWDFVNFLLLFDTDTYYTKSPMHRSGKFTSLTGKSTGTGCTKPRSGAMARNRPTNTKIAAAWQRMGNFNPFLQCVLAVKHFCQKLHNSQLQSHLHLTDLERKLKLKLTQNRFQDFKYSFQIWV